LFPRKNTIHNIMCDEELYALEEYLEKHYCETTTIFISSCGINAGCGTIALSLEDALDNKYKIIHLSSGGSCHLLTNLGKVTFKLPSISNYYNNYGLDYVSQITKNIANVYEMNNTVYKSKFECLMKKFRPVCTISVFENFLSSITMPLDIKNIEISDQLYWTLSNYRDDELVLKYLYTICLHRFISNYNFGIALSIMNNPGNVYASNVSVFSPLLPNDVLKRTPSYNKAGCILVYISGITNQSDTIYPILSQFEKERFIVFINYNDSVPPVAFSNIIFRKFDRNTFIDTLKDSKLLISNSGMSTSSEAIYFQVPILALPTKNHWGQRRVGKDMLERNVCLLCFDYDHLQNVINHCLNKIKHNDFNKIKTNVCLSNQHKFKRNILTIIRKFRDIKN